MEVPLQRVPEDTNPRQSLAATIHLILVKFKPCVGGSVKKETVEKTRGEGMKGSDTPRSGVVSVVNTLFHS